MEIHLFVQSTIVTGTSHLYTAGKSLSGCVSKTKSLFQEGLQVGMY